VRQFAARRCATRGWTGAHGFAHHQKLADRRAAEISGVAAGAASDTLAQAAQVGLAFPKTFDQWRRFGRSGAVIGGGQLTAIGPRDEVLRKVLRQPPTLPAALAVAADGKAS
jgi:hypothetical protein